MTIYFAFSDESGNYKQYRNIRFNQLNPYYIRASFLISGDQWLYLDYLFRELKDEFQIPTKLEVKYSDIWTLTKYHEDNNRKISPRLQEIIQYQYPIEILINFISRSINLLQELDYVNIIITITKNDSILTINEKFIYTVHIQNLMQRIQKECQDIDENNQSDDSLCLIFVDPVSNKINKLLTESYNALFLNGDFFTEYSKIKDCLHFELSHHSSGIQIADYIAGVTYGYLKGRQDSIGIFNDQIRQHIRVCPSGKTMGCGIIEIPSNSKVRRSLTNQFGA